MHATSITIVGDGRSVVRKGTKASHVATLPRWRLAVPSYGCNEADELCEIAHVVASAPRGKRVVGKVIEVVPHAVLRIEECLYMLPRVLGRCLNT